MRLPIIKGGNLYKRQIVTFGGLNMLQNYSEGELCMCEGISHIAFPAITQRRKSESVFSCQAPSAMIFEDKECVAANEALYYDRKKVASLSPGNKILGSLCKKIVVFPDKIFYDTVTGEVGDLQGKCATGGAQVDFKTNSISVPEEYPSETSVVEKVLFGKNNELITYESAERDGVIFVMKGFSLKKTVELNPGDIFCERCEPNQYRKVIFVNEDTDDGTVEVENELITLENCVNNLFSAFKEGDTVEISGCVGITENNLSAQIVSVEKNKLTFSDATFTEGTETAVITIMRKIPDFTCICSYANRLWGCEGNTIYASAQGDITNFFTYKGISTDSYSVMSNTSGDFTACIPYGSYCLFFKENSCYKLYGNRPSNFQLTETFAGGIPKTEAGSLSVVNGMAIYKGNGGIYAYSGGIPRCISDKLQGIRMQNTVCASDTVCCYISADTSEGREEFVWDMEKNLWSKSGVKDVKAYCFYEGILYRLLPDGVEKVCEEADSEADWSITLCPFDENYYKTKNYSRLYVNVHLYENASITTAISCDDGPWQEIDSTWADRKKYLNIPCVIKSCHSVKLRLQGKGRCMLESVTREFSVN